jgi:multidrug efflux pump subunit AcrA (membrane-fusion protein)
MAKGYSKDLSCGRSGPVEYHCPGSGDSDTRAGEGLSARRSAVRRRHHPRNIDNGSLVQSQSTFMFTLMHPDVIRSQLYVPQDAAFGVAPGVDAVVHVPEIPDRSFPGKVTRIASALQPGSRTLLTEVDVPNPDGALSPGIYCTVEL